MNSVTVIPAQVFTTFTDIAVRAAHQAFRALFNDSSYTDGYFLQYNEELNKFLGVPAAAADINDLVPSQTGHNGEFLSTNGSVVSWAAGGGSGSVPSGLTFFYDYLTSIEVAAGQLNVNSGEGTQITFSHNDNLGNSVGPTIAELLSPGAVVRVSDLNSAANYLYATVVNASVNESFTVTEVNIISTGGSFSDGASLGFSMAPALGGAVRSNTVDFDSGDTWTPGTVIGKMPIYNEQGDLAGYFPIYDNIANA